MKHTKEEIINALKVIKEVCAEHERCNECPFYNDEGGAPTACSLNSPYTPSTWKLNEPEPEKWRALK